MVALLRVIDATGAGDESATTVGGLVPTTGPAMLPVRMSITHVSEPSEVRSFAQVRTTSPINPADTVKLPLNVLPVKSEGVALEPPDVSRIIQ